MEQQPLNPAQLIAFRQLGLTSDADEAAVRRAYAQRLKTCSPETDPEGWMRLHNAFKTALTVFIPASSEQGGASSQNIESLWQQGTDEGDEYGELFGELEELASQAEQEQKELYDAHERELNAAKDRRAQALYQKVEKKVNRLVRRSHFHKLQENELKELFSSYAWQQLREERPETLRAMIDRLKTQVDHMSYEAIALFVMESRPWQGAQPFFQAQQTAAYAQKQSRQKRNRRIMWWVLAAMFLFAVVVPSGKSGSTTGYRYTSPRLTPIPMPQLNSLRPQSSPAPAFDRSDPVSEVQNSTLAPLVLEIALGECIARYALDNGAWSSEGERVTVSAGEGRRAFYAVFSLDSADSDEAVATLQPTNRSEPIYVLAFRICGRNIRGPLNTILFTMTYDPNPVDSLEEYFRSIEKGSKS